MLLRDLIPFIDSSLIIVFRYPTGSELYFGCPFDVPPSVASLRLSAVCISSNIICLFVF